MDKTATRLSLPESPRDFGFYVDGASVPAGGREVFTRHSPGHGVPVTRMVKCTGEDLDAAVASARRAFEDRRWSGLSGGERSAVLLKAAEAARRGGRLLGDARERQAHRAGPRRGAGLHRHVRVRGRPCPRASR